MSHSIPTSNTIMRILHTYIPPNEQTAENFDMLYDAIMDHIEKIEKAEYQKARDSFGEDVAASIKEVEGLIHSHDPKYWENLYCELRNRLVRTT